MIADAAVEMVKNDRLAFEAETGKKGWHVVHKYRRVADKARDRIRTLAEQLVGEER